MAKERYMTHDEIMDQIAKDSADDLAKAIYHTFRTEEGKSVLAWILNQCGLFETRPERMKPELIALGNRILQAGHMQITGDMGAYTTAVIESYEHSDLEKVERS